MPRKYWYTRSSREDKLSWLLKNQSLWEGWEDIGDHRKRDVVEKMRKDGLLSEKTNWQDVNLTSLIGEARRLRREVNFRIKKMEE